MKAAVLVVQVLVGLMYVVFGLNYFGRFIPIPPPPTDSLGHHYLVVALIPSGYLAAVKVLEILGGLLLLTGRLPLVGLLILTPISLNIFFYELFLLKQPGPGFGLLPMCLFLVWAYRRHLTALVAVKPAVG